MNRPDSEGKSTYVGMAKRCQESRRRVMRANEHQKGMRRITRHPSRSEESKYSNTTFFNKNWDKDRERRTMPPQKRKSFNSDSRASTRVPQQKQFDEAQSLGTVCDDSQQSEDNKQLLNNWSGIHSWYRVEFGNVTQQVQTNATSERPENNSGDYMKQRPRNSRLSRTSKSSSGEATDEDNTLLLTIPFHQDKSRPQLTCSAQSNKPANTVYKEDNLVENDWAGYNYYRNDLPRIVAVHTIVDDRNENTQRKELSGAKRLSSTEKKEWNRLLVDLSSSSSDGYYNVEHKMSSSNVHVYSTRSELGSVSDQHYPDPTYLMRIFDKRISSFNS